MALMMASLQSWAHLNITEDLGEQTVVAFTDTFTGEWSGLAPGWSAEEDPLKQEEQSTEPLLEEEETGCHQKKAGSVCMMGAAGTGERF